MREKERKRERKEREKREEERKREKREKEEEKKREKEKGEKKRENDVQGQLLSIYIQFSKIKTKYIGRNDRNLKN